MKVLVTGVTGFIGYSLSSRLVELGYDVYGLVRFSSQGKKIPSNVTPIVGDLTDYHSVAKAVQSVRPEVVVHLGALTPVSESFHQPIAYMEANCIGTVNLLEALRRHDHEALRLFVYAGTTELFNAEVIDESTPICPTTSPYAVSKACGYYYSKYMYETYRLPVVIVIPTNTYGRALVGQRHFVVEKIITSMLERRKVIEMGSPDAIRDFMFREDHVNAYISVIKSVVDYGKDVLGQHFCFGTGIGHTIREVFEMCRRLTGWDGAVRWNVYVRPNEPKKIIVNPRKAREVLGWEPKYDLESGLRQAIKEWKEVLRL